MKHTALLLLLQFLPVVAAFPQKVDLRSTHERLVAVVDMTGSGTAADPRRPAFAPAPPAKGQAPSRNGILAYSYEVTDDGRQAIVEFVALDRAAFREILADARLAGKVFEKGKHKREDIERELKKVKKNLDLDRLAVRVP